ncbi:hypothetical protein ACTFIY_007960 [Dictyostelium cf. discoideum]
MNNTIRIGVWNVQGSTTQSASIINTVLDNNRTRSQIKTTTKTINERIITSEWIIAKTLFQCTTIYAPAKSNKRYKWYQEKLLHSDIITGDFNVDCSVDNNLNKYIKTIFEEFQFTELKNGITFPRNG